MLQLIILGLVPGTSIQITFTWVLCVLLAVALLLLVRIELRRFKNFLKHNRHAQIAQQETQTA